MFRAIRASDLPGRGVYTVTIGDGVKSTDADWYLSDPTEVLATIMMLNNSDLVGDVTGEGGRRNDNSPRHSQVLPMPRSYLIRSDS